MANAVVVRIERLHNNRIGHQRKHDLRLYTDQNRPSYIDTSRTSLNSVLVKPLSRDELLAKVHERRANAKRKLKKNAVWLWSGLIGFGVEAQEKIRQLTIEKQNQIFYEIAQSIAEYLQTDIESLTVHRDETSIHAHFTIFNHTKDGTTLSKKMKWNMYSELQDIAAKVLQKHGLNIQRGKKKAERLAEKDYARAIHRSVRQLHFDLPTEIRDKQEQLKKLDEEIEARKKLLDSIMANIGQLQHRQGELVEKVKTYEERVKKQEEKLKKLLETQQSTESDMRSKIDQANKTLNIYRKRIQDAKTELQAVQNQIEEKKKEFESLLTEITTNNYKEKYKNAKAWLDYTRDILKYIFDVYDLYREKWLFEEMPDLYSVLGIQKPQQEPRQGKGMNM